MVFGAFRKSKLLRASEFKQHGSSAPAVASLVDEWNRVLVESHEDHLLSLASAYGTNPDVPRFPVPDRGALVLHLIEDEDEAKGHEGADDRQDRADDRRRLGSEPR